MVIKCKLNELTVYFEFFLIQLKFFFEEYFGGCVIFLKAKLWCILRILNVWKEGALRAIQSLRDILNFQGLNGL
jgi:hypothetical protein